MGCCNSRREQDNHEILADRKSNTSSFIAAEGEHQKVKGGNREVNLQIIEGYEKDNTADILSTFRRNDAETNRTDDILIIDTANVEHENNGIKPKKKAMSKIPITVAQSEPQNLDPNNVYFVENRNVSPSKVRSDTEVKPDIIVRQATVDRILEEKIKNKVDFEDLLKDDRLEQLMK
jgi:hypothetical protein